MQVGDWFTALLPSFVKNAKCQLTRVKRYRSKSASFQPARRTCHGVVVRGALPIMQFSVIVVAATDQLHCKTFSIIGFRDYHVPFTCVDMWLTGGSEYVGVIADPVQFHRSELQLCLRTVIYLFFFLGLCSDVQLISVRY